MSTPFDSTAFTLPVRAQDVLSGSTLTETVPLEMRHGNTELITLLDLLGIGGPFTVESPWELRDEEGRHLIHAGGYAAVPFGEKYPPLMQFLQDYLERGSQLGLPQQSASEWRAALETNLVALLAAVAPSHTDSGVFFGSSGAEAIEVAMKMARANRPNKPAFINFTSAYHGKTFGALSVTPNPEYQDLFKPFGPEVFTVPYGDANALEDELKRNSHKVAAIIVEPVQGEAGVVIPPPDFLRQLGELAKQYDVLVIADEIQSGLGRVGELFASVAAGLEPDIITLAKPLSGGIVPLSATIGRRELYKTFLPGISSKRHSTTFGGNSLAMAAGVKSLELIVTEGLVERAKRNGEYGKERLLKLKEAYPKLIADVRAQGMLFALVLQPPVGMKIPGVSAEDVQMLGSALGLRAMQQAGVHGCYSINSNRIIRLTPPLNMPENLFTEMFDRIDTMAKENSSSFALLRKFPLPRLLRLAKLAL